LVAWFGFFLSSVISLKERLFHLFAKPSTQGGDGMEPKGFHRKLTAILSADVAGYSRLMQDDEAATVKTLESYKKAISIEEKMSTTRDEAFENSYFDALRRAGLK
jgi:hypothetical protein